VFQPGLIWGYASTEGGARMIEDCDEVVDADFRWLHLNLADQRSQIWIDRALALPPTLRQVLAVRDGRPRALVEQGVLALVLHDFERDFDAEAPTSVGALHVVLTPGLIITGRFHPLHSPDLVRKRIAAGSPVRTTAEALEHALAGVVDSIAAVVLDVSAVLVAAEDRFLASNQAPDTRELVGLRRRAAQAHRMIVGMRATLHQLGLEPRLPPLLAPVATHFGQRLIGLDAEILATQNQLKLLRDELDLQAAQRSNQNIYLLSVMTALVTPATLVTGFFGMNTGGLPFATGRGGTLLAGIAAMIASAGAYFALRAFGLVRRQ
jgi:zinc transporter